MMNKNKFLKLNLIMGGVYQYFDVPKDEYEALMSANSHGKYFYYNIRDDYEYEKI